MNDILDFRSQSDRLRMSTGASANYANSGFLASRPPSAETVFGVTCSRPGSVLTCRKGRSAGRVPLDGMLEAFNVRRFTPKLGRRHPAIHAATRRCCDSDVLAKYPSHAFRAYHLARLHVDERVGAVTPESSLSDLRLLKPPAPHGFDRKPPQSGYESANKKRGCGIGEFDRFGYRHAAFLCFVR